MQELRLGGGVELDLPSLARYSGEGSCRLVTAVWPGTDRDKVPIVYRYLDMTRYILSRYLCRRLCKRASLLAGVAAWAGLCGRRTAARAA